MDLTRACQRMVRRFSGGTRALAVLMDMSDTTLNHKASPTYPGQFFSPEEVQQLTDETNDNDFLNTFCAHRGGMFMPVAEGKDGLTDGELVVVMRETSQFVSALADSRSKRSPGAEHVTDNELSEIEREAAEAITAIQECVRRARSDNAAAKPAYMRAA
jgi:hypothetical protein